jgi:nucleoside-diphosphate-sugar epimerase
MKKQNILVTGANGFIGHHLCRKLLDNKHHVLALTRSKKPKHLQSLLKKPGLSLQVGDINNNDFIKGLFGSNKIDVVFHMAIEAAHNGNIHQHQVYQTNVLGTINLIQQASQQGTSVWIQSSSMSVYDYENPEKLPVNEGHPAKPREPYGLSKLLTEEVCKYYNLNSNLKCLVLRYSGVFGHSKKRGIIAKLINTYLNSSSETIDVDINRTSDFVYVGDVVNANSLAMEKALDDSFDPQKTPSIFNIGSGMETSIKDLAEMIIEITGAKLNINPISSHHPRRFYYDISAAKKILKYFPRNIRQGLVEYIEKEKVERGGFAN